MNLSARHAAASLASAVFLCFFAAELPNAQSPSGGVPIFEVDASWPKFEGNWIFGSIGGVFVDPTNDHVWVSTAPEPSSPTRITRHRILRSPTAAFHLRS